MKRDRVVSDYVCDICGTSIGSYPSTCSICGKDICETCSRYLCKKVELKLTGGPSAWDLGRGTQYTEEAKLCKSCVDSLKLALHIAAGKDL